MLWRYPVDGKRGNHCRRRIHHTHQLQASAIESALVSPARSAVIARTSIGRVEQYGECTLVCPRACLPPFVSVSLFLCKKKKCACVGGCAGAQVKGPAGE